VERDPGGEAALHRPVVVVVPVMGMAVVVMAVVLRLAHALS